MPERPCCYFCIATEFATRSEAESFLKSTTAFDVAEAHFGRTRTDDETPSSPCYRLGPVTRNPFLNYMRHLRETTCSPAGSILELAKRAGYEWRRMNENDKHPFVMDANRVPWKMVRRTRRTFHRLRTSMSRVKRLNSRQHSLMNASQIKRHRSMANVSGLINVSAIKIEKDN